MDAALERVLAGAAAAMEAAGAIARQHFRARPLVDDKGGHRFDPVTEADRAIERLLRARLAALLPGIGMVGEEFGREGSTEDYWIIDPIDGTRAFISGMLGWGTLVGLVLGGKPVAGLMHQPFTHELFQGGEGHGAWLRHAGTETRLATSATRHLADAVLYSTHPDLLHDAGLAAPYQALAKACRLQRYGGDCYAYAMLAAGHIDLVVEAGLAPYDIVPLVPLIMAAGGVVTDLTGSLPLAGGTVVAAANATLHAAAMAALRR